MCETWFDLCHNEQFIVLSDKDNMLDFANETLKYEGKKLYTIVNDAEEFCNRMGYIVHDKPYCYNGIPIGQKIDLSKEKPQWNKQRPTNKGIVSMSFYKLLSYFLTNTQAYGNYLFYLGLILIVIMILYEVNIWQQKMRQEQIDISKQIKQKLKINQEKRIKKRKILDILRGQINQQESNVNQKQHNKQIDNIDKLD
ncbi:UNKNOWN [Stylonychia lemnae]|uniref:Transmembrane protein n=1 Tax=Stylonychia lemnae TaxID=5949 RepID=A0A078AZE1_STYLE|nr:UNKNOWN [Stylonychia lemnae]|eukprot:CDW86572.1 UNKNOWN [Stylonychia lemnae]